jgi:nitrous oxide reductase accessory protein NosL
MRHWIIEHYDNLFHSPKKRVGKHYDSTLDPTEAKFFTSEAKARKYHARVGGKLVKAYVEIELHSTTLQRVQP